MKEITTVILVNPVVMEPVTATVMVAMDVTVIVMDVIHAMIAMKIQVVIAKVYDINYMLKGDCYESDFCQHV